MTHPTGLDALSMPGDVEELQRIAAIAGDRPLTRNQMIGVLRARGVTGAEVEARIAEWTGAKVAPKQVSTDCAVCGRICGDLNGNTKSWRCAGKVHALRQQARQVADGYSLPGKQKSRTLAVASAQRLGAESVLELWGGGTSAEQFRAVLRPTASVTSCEIDKTLWQAARLHAHEHGYRAWLGDVVNAPGTFDFVWLDFCGQWSAKMDDTVMKVARDRLAPAGHIAVTVMPAREGDGFLARSRAVSIPALLVVATRRPLAYIERYRRAGGQEMWMAVLGSRGESVIDFVGIHDAMAVDGYWAAESWLGERRTRRGSRGRGRRMLRAA